MALKAFQERAPPRPQASPVAGDGEAMKFRMAPMLKRRDGSPRARLVGRPRRHADYHHGGCLARVRSGERERPPEGPAVEAR